MTDLKGYELTHKKILESGREHFLREGFERANLRQICRDAGVTTGAFYRHFEDKEALFSALVEPFLAELLRFYQTFEAASFESLDREEPEALAEINADGAVETALFIFARKDLFTLLTEKAYGTKYDHFVEQFVAFEDENRKKVFRLLAEKRGGAKDVPELAIHLLNHAYMNALCELVIHCSTEREVAENTRLIAVFFNEGWRRLHGF